MPYIPFYDICPRVADKETRVITIQQNDNEFDLPRGEYVFIELFCDECDCRRVFLQVIMNQEIVATIVYGWEKISFYRNEFRGFSKSEIKALMGPSVDSFQYQSIFSNRILRMFNKLLFPDKEYLNRITKHYDLFKKTLKT